MLFQVTRTTATLFTGVLPRSFYLVLGGHVGDGAAASREEDVKRARYPGPLLRPFVVEAHGRPGETAMSFLRDFAPSDPEVRSKVLADAWQSLSVVLQTANAEIALSATN